MDRLDPASRSENMRRIRGKDTAPELQLRRLVHSMGYRYRLHDKRLPGTPDLVFRSRRKVIFVHGCFWHLHTKCKQARIPSTRLDYWVPKLTRNAERDREHTRRLGKLGWQVLVIWECQLRDADKLSQRVRRFLDSP